VNERQDIYHDFLEGQTVDRCCQISFDFLNLFYMGFKRKGGVMFYKHFYNYMTFFRPGSSYFQETSASHAKN
jgi:hypothetical protein